MRNDQILEQFKLLTEAEKSERREVRKSVDKMAAAVTTLTISMAESKERDEHFRETIVGLKKSIDDTNSKHDKLYALAVKTDKRVESNVVKIEAGEKDRRVMWQKINDHDKEITNLKARVSTLENEDKNLKENVKDNKDAHKNSANRYLNNLEKLAVWAMRGGIAYLIYLLTTGPDS